MLQRPMLQGPMLQGPVLQPAVLRASPAVAAALQADGAALADLAGRLGRSLILRTDPALPAHGWAIGEDAA